MGAKVRSGMEVSVFVGGGKWDLSKKGGRGGVVELRGWMEREKVLIEERGATEVG